MNDKLARRWGGSSGVVRYTFRWPTVRRQVTDILTALEPDGAKA